MNKKNKFNFLNRWVYGHDLLMSIRFFCNINALNNIINLESYLQFSFFNVFSFKNFIFYGWGLYIILMQTIIFSLATFICILGVFDLLNGIFPSDDFKGWKFLRFFLILRGCLCIFSSFFVMLFILFGNQ